MGVARVAAPELLAHFLLANLAFQIVLVQLRTSVGQPFLVHRSTAGIDERASEREYLAAVTATGLAVTAIALVVTPLLPAAARDVYLVLAATFPVLALADGVRFLAIARGAPGQALVVDGARVLLFVAVVAAWTVAGDPRTLGVVVVRSVAVAVALALGYLVTRTRPVAPAIRTWWRENRRMSIAFGAEGLMNRVSSYSVTYGLVWFASLAAVAGFRSGSSLTNLVGICFASVPMVLVPHYRRRMSASDAVVPRGELMRIGLTVSAALVGITALGAVVLLNLPESVGEQLLGETWEYALDSLPGLLFWTAGDAATLGPLLVLRATARTRQSVVARTVQSIATVVLGFAGAWLGGAPGAAWGVGLGAWLGAAAWYRLVWADGGWDPRTDAIRARQSPDAGDATLAGSG